MTKKTEAGLDTGRRDFLKMAGTSAPLAAVAVATGATTAEAAEPDLSRETMQDTAHTRAFYETARF
ncbi:MAG: twin-arginine translocation pathway signal protein [Pseudomonadota bacterium]